MSQARLFKKEGKVITKEDIKAKKEAEKLEKLCVLCMEYPKVEGWDEEAKQMCVICQVEYYKKKFEELNIPNGFRDEGNKYVFYSITTGVEEVNKKNVLTILARDRIQTCDEFGCFTNCFGITEEFADYVINDLKLVESSGTWENKKIIPNEKAKEINELKKELSIKRTELTELLTKVRILESGD